MRLSSVALLSSAALLNAVPTLGSPTKQSCSKPDLTVQINSGTVLGAVDSANPDVRQFLGIPYAKPPLGDLRFAPSEAVESFGEFDATTLPPSCMQYLSSLPSIWNNEVNQFNQDGLNTTGRVSEDCLTISVWAPRGAKKNLPVLLWIYGGSFKFGGESVPYQIPTQWVQRTQDHVVVSFNYRINIFGFPNAAGLDDDKQNLGLLDQRLAVEWVRDNIAAFGGDVNRIGLWGQSAGAISVAYYSYTYPKDPIVSSLLMDSGNEYLDITSVDTPHSNFTFMASQFGCGDLKPREELACMRRVDAFAITDFIHEYVDNGTTPEFSFAPITDEKTVFSDFYDRAVNGNIAALPTLMGSNRDDGVPFVPYSADGVNATLVRQVTMQYFFCPTYKSANNRVAAGAPVFRYEYSGNFSNISPKPWMGTWHNSELPLLFGTHSNYRGPSTALENATSIAMQDAWLSLVSGGEAATLGQGWPLYNVNSGSLMREFGRDVAAQTTNFEDWESLCPETFQP
ncbi:chlorogenic acid esterase precursor [Seiridium cupressi]